jgi:hypothetical protein
VDAELERHRAGRLRAARPGWLWSVLVLAFVLVLVRVFVFVFDVGEEVLLADVACDARKCSALLVIVVR